MDREDNNFMMMQKKFLISICIPTYNRDKIVYDCVRQILQQEDEELEVVVGDNCSVDKTQEVIASIQDERLSYFRNDTNIGYVNILETMKHAHGDYCFLLSDEDDFRTENIERLKLLLTDHKNAAVLITGIRHLSEKTLTFQAGQDAVFQCVSNMPGYMSGLIFDREIVMECLGKTRQQELFFQLFPHLNVGPLCCMKGGLVLTGSEFVRTGVRRGRIDHVANRVTVAGMHWESESRLLQASGRFKALRDCGLDQQTRLRLGLIQLKNYTISSSIGLYKIIHEDMTSWNLSEEKQKELDSIRKQPKKYWFRMIRKNYKKIREMLEEELLEKRLWKSLLQHPKYLALYLKGKMKIWVEAMGKIR